MNPTGNAQKSPFFTMMYGDKGPAMPCQCALSSLGEDKGMAGEDQWQTSTKGSNFPDINLNGPLQRVQQGMGTAIFTQRTRGKASF